MEDNRTGLLCGLYSRNELIRDEFLSYWREIHGVLIASAEGLWDYRQITLETSPAAEWPFVSEPDPSPIDGLAELVFGSSADEARFYESISGFGRDDEQVFLRRVDAFPVDTAQTMRLRGTGARSRDASLHTMLIVRDSRAVGGLSDRSAELVELLSARPEAATVRGTAVRNGVAGRSDVWVDRESGEAEGAAVFLELALASRGHLKRILREEGLVDLIREFHRDYRVSAYRVSRSLAYVARGAVLQAGRHGAHAADLIERLGALHLTDY